MSPHRKNTTPRDVYPGPLPPSEELAKAAQMTLDKWDEGAELLRRALKKYRQREEGR